jgi:hypothetical protein
MVMLRTLNSESRVQVPGGVLSKARQGVTMEIKEFRKIVAELPDTLTDEQWWDAFGDAELLVLKARTDAKRAGRSK